MCNIKKISSVAVVLLTALPVAQAAESDIFKMNGQFGQVPYTRTAEGWVTGTVGVDGAGLDQTASLFFVSYSFATGQYSYWRGAIPVDSVVVNGVSSISVNIDTCTVNNVSGCGPVNFTVTTNEPATGWIDNGVSTYTDNGYIRNDVGARQVRASSATGSINGIAFTTGRAFSGKYDEVTISVTIGN